MGLPGLAAAHGESQAGVVQVVGYHNNTKLSIVCLVAVAVRPPKLRGGTQAFPGPQSFPLCLHLFGVCAHDRRRSISRGFGPVDGRLSPGLHRSEGMDQPEARLYVSGQSAVVLAETGNHEANPQIHAEQDVVTNLEDAANAGYQGGLRSVALVWEPREAGDSQPADDARRQETVRDR